MANSQRREALPGTDRGVSGVAMPFAFASLVEEHVYATKMRADALGLLVLTGSTLPMESGRLPAAQAHPSV